MDLLFNGGLSYNWDDPGLHQAIRITSNSTCYDAQVVNGAYVFRINPGGANCAKEVYPTGNGYIYDEPCSTTDPLEQFVAYQDPNSGGDFICLKQYEGGNGSNCVAHALAVSADLSTEIVGARQLGPDEWDTVCVRNC
jgi:hypothetical protein